MKMKTLFYTLNGISIGYMHNNYLQKILIFYIGENLATELAQILDIYSFAYYYSDRNGYIFRSDDNSVLYQYKGLLTIALKSFRLLILNGRDDYSQAQALDIYLYLYHALLNIEIPIEIEELFQEMGWLTEGHKKFWTIYFYYEILRLEKYYIENDLLDLVDFIRKLITTANQQDMELIRNNYESLDFERFK
jgi:hypothetical protein